MCMDDNKVVAKNEKELETLIQTIGIKRQNTGMQFAIEKCANLILKTGNSGKKENYKYQDILEV